MTRPARLLLCSLAGASFGLFGADSAHAQDDVMRDVYGFFGSSLNVELAAEAPGRIRLVRGRHSRIEVAGRAPNGFTSAALGGRGVRRLTLTALGADEVEFIVIVPENVRVRVRWEGSTRSELFGSLARTATYAWETPDERPAFETVRPNDRRASGAEPTLREPTDGSTSTPRILDIEHAERLERLTVRIEGPAFRISPVTLDARSSGDRLGLRAPDAGDVTIFVPEGDRFTLRLNHVDAIVIDGDVRILCDGVLSQSLPDGRRWLTLAPSALGGCSTPAPPSRSTPAGHRHT